MAGNSGGPGNPFAARVGRLRAALIDAVAPDDVRQVVQRLVAKAKAGDIAAAKVLFERVLGRPLQADIIERIEALEEQVRGQACGN